MRYLLFFLFFSSHIFAQQNEGFKIDSLPTQGIVLDKGWKWQEGDNPDFAKADFDDSHWENIDPTKDIHELPLVFNSKIKWLRLNFEIKNKHNNPLGISINQAGASELYLNGRLIHQIGHIDSDSNKIIASDPIEIPLPIPIDSVGEYTLAIRYCLQPNIHYTKLYAMNRNSLFYATINDLTYSQNNNREFRVYFTALEAFKIGLFLMLFILHISFYSFQRNNKTHLLLSLAFFAPIF